MKRVYFIKPVGMAGPIKIGNSVSPTGRRDALAIWSPFPLEIIAEIDGDDLVEARFHRLFLDSHERLEWFSWTPELQTVVEQINAGTFEVETLPAYAGKLATLRTSPHQLSEIDEEYLAVLRRYQRSDWRVVGFYHGRRPEIGSFAKIKSDAKKREIIDGLEAFLGSAA